MSSEDKNEKLKEIAKHKSVLRGIWKRVPRQKGSVLGVPVDSLAVNEKLKITYTTVPDFKISTNTASQVVRRATEIKMSPDDLVRVAVAQYDPDNDDEALEAIVQMFSETLKELKDEFGNMNAKIEELEVARSDANEIREKAKAKIKESGFKFPVDWVD